MISSPKFFLLLRSLPTRTDVEVARGKLTYCAFDMVAVGAEDVLRTNRDTPVSFEDLSSNDDISIASCRV